LPHNINCRKAINMNYFDDVLTPRSVNASSSRWRVRELWRPRGHRVHLISTCTFQMMSPTANVIGNNKYHKIVIQFHCLFSFEQNTFHIWIIHSTYKYATTINSTVIILVHNTWNAYFTETFTPNHHSNVKQTKMYKGKN